MLLRVATIRPGNSDKTNPLFDAVEVKCLEKFIYRGFEFALCIVGDPSFEGEDRISFTECTSGFRVGETHAMFKKPKDIKRHVFDILEEKSDNDIAIAIQLCHLKRYNSGILIPDFLFAIL